MNLLLPLLAGLLAAISLLTRVHAPNWMWAWKLTILAGEFGHWLLLLPLVLAAATVSQPAGAGRTVTLVLCAFAAVGFLRPVYEAQRLARKISTDLDTAFGSKRTDRPVWSWVRLYGVTTTRAGNGVITETFAQPDGQELKVDFYAAVRAPNPAGVTATGAPCIVVIHGGGWDGGDRKQLDGWNSRWAARGYAVAAISYRLAPQWKWPMQAGDVGSAIAWLKAHAARLGIDPTRLVLLGRSAGGQIASAVGYAARDPAIRGVIALYAPHDMPFVWSVSREDDALNSAKLMRQYMGGPPDEASRPHYVSASGQLLAGADSPPTLLVHGLLDTLSWYRHSERLGARLTELGVPHYYLRLPWGTHGFDFNPHGPGGQLADYAIDRFLATVTGSPG